VWPGVLAVPLHGSQAQRHGSQQPLVLALPKVPLGDSPPSA
jgi:hypothetical protein